jgi:hypothetical protein
MCLHVYSRVWLRCIAVAKLRYLRGLGEDWSDVIMSGGGPRLRARRPCSATRAASRPARGRGLDERAAR